MTREGTGSSTLAIDWREISRLVLTSRAIDHLEETELYPQKRIAYQFSAAGHELAQVILGRLLTHPKDAASAYYRSRPLLLSLGLTIEEAFAGPLGKQGGYSDGRDIGVVCNLPSRGGATVLPMAGDVGSQYTPAAGWAEAIRYHFEVLGLNEYDRAVAVVLGGEGSTATNGFWAALGAATTVGLPLIFFVEDNGYAISVPAEKQTPGGNIADNLKAFRGLQILQGDGTDPFEAAELIATSVEYARSEWRPVLLRLSVPRLRGHSGQDSQAYKTESLKAIERERDPLERVRGFVVPKIMSSEEWTALERTVAADVRAGLERALALPEPDPKGIYRYRFSERGAEGEPLVALVGGCPGPFDRGSGVAESASPVRINMLEAIRKTLETELRLNERMVVFGEDVGPKGGVHAVTLGLQEMFSDRRVFDTSLSEEAIIGRAAGMSLAGMLPVPEIQFRKYADPATEQLHNCGTLRWRTANRFASPMVVRLAGGYSRRAGDPWHSVMAEVAFAHAPGWQVVIPAHASDAVGLLRAALRSANPTIFFEHRALLDAPWARRPYPGDRFVLPLGQAAVTAGSDLTLVTWGAMVERCEAALGNLQGVVELIDLRTIMPWDRQAVTDSVRKTHRCLIVHEDGWTAGFGAEIAATLAADCFTSLDAPIRRMAPEDVPIPYHPELMEAVLPSVAAIREAVSDLLGY